MTAEAEREAAYFTLLRAQEERDDLLRYREFLTEEDDRLRAFTLATREREELLPGRLRRPIEQTTKQLVEAVRRRQQVVGIERRRSDDRINAAEAFVAECEADLDRLRSR